MDLAFLIILGCNALWFAAGFQYFSFNPFAAAKLLVNRSQRDSPLFKTLAESGRFLGGMNAAFAGVFALAHGSQFVFNLRVARG